MSETLKERIDQAAYDMSMDCDENGSAGDHLLQFLSAHELDIVEKHPTLGSHAADLAALRGEQEQNRKLQSMLDNMIAAPTIWRRQAKEMLVKMKWHEVEKSAEEVITLGNKFEDTSRELVNAWNALTDSQRNALKDSSLERDVQNALRVVAISDGLC